MLERLLLSAALAVLVSPVPAAAANAVLARTSLSKAGPQKVLLPGTGFVVDPDAPPVPARSADAQRALMAALVHWLAQNFALPKSDEYPSVQLASTAKITTFRFTGRLSDRPQDRAAVPPAQREVVAAYDPAHHTIYLPAGWTGRSAAELSVLVHELVHHLQQLASTRHECPQAAEDLAYEAQERWLRLFGRSLESDFAIDPFTRLVSTRCLY